MESLNFIQGSKNMTLYSEQQLVDCAGSYGNQGCDGGASMYAFQYVSDNGIVTESEYPYVAKDQKCKIDKGPFKISGFDLIDEDNCKDLQNQLNIQPVTVSVDANNWTYYTSGIVSVCGSDIDHSVLAVGYTSTYWIVKNSWGTDWGEQGYIQLAKGNTCSICYQASFPEL
eukprot:TRINITY_DN16367_c0_g1_i2.p1 TRINITY_DN16367_c0_g1~~TRINITY_DN16367_c0_g1_i2.p1  ORF type:complete len:171 (+),score=24.94 TRINITY_DN16367_c0_g1_i2:356-868(+)